MLLPDSSHHHPSLYYCSDPTGPPLSLSPSSSSHCQQGKLSKLHSCFLLKTSQACSPGMLGYSTNLYLEQQAFSHTVDTFLVTPHLALSYFDLPKYLLVPGDHCSRLHCTFPYVLLFSPTLAPSPLLGLHLLTFN